MAWGKTRDSDRLILEKYNPKSGQWSYVEDVGINGAARICRGTAKKTKIRHRVRNINTGNIYCENDG